MNREILEESGIDYAAGLRRFLEDQDLYEKMLTAFLSDDSFSKASDAFRDRDYAALFEQTHALKGVSGNLDMPELYHGSGELTEYLRHNNTPEENTVSVLFDKISKAYQRVIAGIHAASG